MQGGDEVNIQELASNLSLYKDQLNQVSSIQLFTHTLFNTLDNSFLHSPPNQVRQLLNDEPSNSEYVDMERELSEVCSFFFSCNPLVFVSYLFSLPRKQIRTTKTSEDPSLPFLRTPHFILVINFIFSILLGLKGEPSLLFPTALWQFVISFKLLTQP